MLQTKFVGMSTIYNFKHETPLYKFTGFFDTPPYHPEGHLPGPVTEVLKHLLILFTHFHHVSHMLFFSYEHFL